MNINQKRKIIDLRFGENPEAFLPAVEAIKKESNKINFYPDPKRKNLISLISKNERIDREKIYISNGIDGAINIILSIYARNDSEIILPIPTFPDYQFAGENLGYKIKKVFLESGFSLNVNALLKNIHKNTRFIIFVNPNNPTGNQLVDNLQVERVLQQFKGFVIIDEAYFELTNKSSIRLLDKYKNLIIFRGFSKGYGLAGLRIGIVFANEEVIKKINETEGRSNKFVVNRFALSAAESVIKNEKLAKQYIKTFLKNKKSFEMQISKIKGVRVLESQTSFCLFELNNSADEIKDKLEKKGILIKSSTIYENFPQNIMIMGVPKEEEFPYIFNSIKEII